MVRKIQKICSFHRFFPRPGLTRRLRGNRFHFRLKLQLKFMNFINLRVMYTQTYFH
jgi:hypothetical protein